MNTVRNPARIVYLDRNGLPQRIQISRPSYPHQWVNYESTRPSDVIERSRDADILVVNKVLVTRDVLRACSHLRHIAVTATGYNVVDLEACREHGISVSNIPSYAATTVSEHVIACALNLRRELPSYRQQVIDGAWQHSPAFCLFGKPVNDLHGATFGVIGLGQIGLATAKLARAIGMRVICTSRHQHDTGFAQQLQLPELLAQADIISVHCNLTPATENLIGTAEIAQMRPQAILINTARGGIVDERAVVAAIESERLGGIAFDVLAKEPPSHDSPLLSIAGRDNVIITPHIAWASEQAMQHLADILTANINAFLNGTPQNIVT